MSRTLLNAIKVISALLSIFLFEYFIYYIFKQSGYQNLTMLIAFLVLFGIIIALVILVPYMMYSWRSSE